CTMGSAGTDTKYARRKAQMQELNMLWGAYMFVRRGPATGSQAAELQVQNFLNEVSKHHAQDTADRVLLAVNWIPYGKAGKLHATPQLVSHICRNIHSWTGVWPLVLVDIHLLKASLLGAI